MKFAGVYILILFLSVYPGCNAANALQIVSRSNAITTTGNAASSGDPLLHEVSSTGRYTAFGSLATNLNVGATYLPYNTLNVSQIFVYDRFLDTIRPATYSYGGITSGGNMASRKPSISDDGCFVTYESQATNLLSTVVLAGTWRIYLTNLCATPLPTTVLVSAAATGDSFRPRVSDQGTVVVYDSASSGIVANDTNGASDVFSYNITSGTTTRISFRPSPSQELQGSSTSASVNADGTQIVFLTTAQNAFSGTNGTVAAQVVYTQTGTNTFVCITCSNNSTASSGASSDPFISSTGAYAVWSTASTIASFSNNIFINSAVRNVFWINITAGISTGSNTARAYSRKVCYNASNNTLNSNSYLPQVTDNGLYIFYVSDASNILTDTTVPVPPVIQVDSNGVSDVYMYSVTTGITSLVSQTYNSASAGNGPSTFPSISRDGVVVVYATNASNIVANDTNGASDVIIAPRVQVELQSCYCSLNYTNITCTYNCTSDGVCAANENSGICINATMGDCFNCTINGVCDCVESETCGDCLSTPCTPNGVCGSNENPHNCPADCHLCSNNTQCQNYTHTANCTVLACDGCVCRETTPNTTCISQYTGPLQCLNYTICDPTNTTGLANANGCVYVLNTVGTSCNDGFNCTYNDTCTAQGQCQGTSNVTVCNALFPKTCLTKACAPFVNGTSDFYDFASGCSYNRTNSSCGDGLSCTSEYCDERVIGNNATTGCNVSFNDTLCNTTFPQTCLSAVCNPFSGSANRIDNVTGCAITRNNATCATGLICNQRYCDEQHANSSMTTGCYTILTPGGTPCEPDLFTCTDALCDGFGTCQQVNNNTNCPLDGTICSVETCDPSQIGGDNYNSTTGCYNQNLAPGTPCESDGYICTMDVCAKDACDHVTNASLCHPFPGTEPFEYAACAFAVCEPGMNGTYQNDTYGCHFHNEPANTSCSDGFTCTDNDVCAGVGFACNGTTNNTVCDPNGYNAVNCTDNICSPRTDGSNSTTGCLTTNSTSGPCDDGVPCTVDACNATGICVGTPNNTYCANIPPALGNPCVNSSCSATLGCLFSNVTNGTSCDNDTFTCTKPYCDGAGNCVVFNDNATCATGNQCIQGICDPLLATNLTTGCYYVNLTTPCDDGKSCTYNDTCGGGVCTGTNNDTFCENLPPALGNVCVTGTCTPDNGSSDATTGCMYVNNTNVCDDGFNCTFPDICSGGVCGTVQNDAFCVAEANSIGECLNATCMPGTMGANSTTGCLFANLTMGQNCTDGQPCTYNDTCSGAGCTGTNNDTYCANLPPALGNVCYTALCNGTNGCVYPFQTTGYPCDNDTYTCTYQLCDGAGNCVTNFNHTFCATNTLCVTDTCSPGSMGANTTTGCLSVNNTDPCSDGYACTYDDTCNGMGVCVGIANNTFCDTGDTCLTGLCSISLPEADNVTGCVNITNSNNCTDGYTCTFPDVCSGGVCSTTPNNATCFDEAQSYDQCLSAACLPASMGSNMTTGCLFFNLTSNESCNDTVFCTINDGCVNGTCVGTPSDATCESIAPGFNNSCITGYCNATTDCYFLNETNGTSCDSDTFTCTTEQCDGAGNCIITYNNATCATGDTCILGICNPSLATNLTTGCYYVNTTDACDDGKSCTYNDTCSGGVCAGTSNNTFCENLPPGFNNTCVDGTCSPLSMDADNTTGCVFTNNTNPCDDSLSCTFPDVCGGGVCGTTPNNAFCGAEASMLGGCYDAVCNSTDPARNLTTGCVFTPAVGLCTDMYTCTINDVCVNVTTCAGTPDNTTCAGLPPALGNLCVGTYCDPPNGQPTSGCVFFNQTGGHNCTNDVFTCTSQACDGVGNCITSYNNTACATGDPCVLGVCDPSQIGHNAVTGCSYSNTTSPCSDAYTCTVDVCANGTCVSTPNNTFCSDGNPCHTATCSPGSPGANNVTGCLIVNNTNACNDGVACTLNDTCSGGVCAGTPTNSSCASGSCFSEYCNATLGCVRTNFTAGTSCTSDNYTCTTEACDGLGSCVITYNTSLCPPSGNQCVAVACSPAIMGANATTGCVYANYPNSTACDDGYGCTSNDICDGNANCVGVPDDNVCAGLPPALGDQCVDGICNITGNANATGCTFINHTRPCNDGKNCTNNDVCGGGVCAGTLDDSTCIVIALMSGQCASGVCQPANISANNITGCVISNLTAGEACNDGVACTSPDICTNGTCVGTPVNASCDPGNLCINFHCDSVLGCVYSNKTAGTPCNSDNATCSTQLCDGAGVCVTTLNNATCATGNVCVDGICDPSSGSANASTGCRTEFNASPCDDGFTCTSPDICAGGMCVGQVNATYCDNISPALNDDCINGLCAVNNPAHDNVTGCVFFYPNGTCDDGFVCTTTDMCSGDFCIGTDNNITCEALAQLMGQCIGTFCDPFDLAMHPNSGCVFYNETSGEPCDDSIACSYNDTCSVTGCHGIANDTACDFLADACGGGACNLTQGCVHTHYPNTTSCDDDAYTCTYQLCDGAGSCNTFENDTVCFVAGNPCYTYRCDPDDPGANQTTGCIQDFNNATCDDGFNCTTSDTCASGVCVGVPVHSFCDALSPSLDNPCIDGYCNVTAIGTDAQGCIFLNNTNPCSDNYTCTDNVCGGGVCIATNNNATCIVEAVNTGVCASGYCDPLMATNASSGCVISTLTTGNPCNDNIGCTGNDTCISNTTCQGTANDTYCDYLDNSCTAGVCNLTGDCLPSYFANNTSCDTDAFTCTYQLCAGNGTCLTYLNNTACVPTGNPCVDNVCDPFSIYADPVTGCRIIDNNNTCDDGFNCTISDTCTAGSCVGTPLNSFCDALSPSTGNPCIDGFCNITAIGHDAQGCIFINNTNSCSDGYACTEDTCSGGVCVSTANDVTCIAEALRNGTCATGTCNPGSATNVTSGCVITTLNTTNPCDDGVACTSNDTCVNTTTCAGTTNDTYCHELFDTSCSASYCNATTGCFSIPFANNTSCDTDAFTCTYQLCAGNGTCITYLNDSVCPPSGNPCIDNVCDPFSLFANATTGCRLMENHVPCDDGFNCTISDTCSGGTCVGTPLNSFCDALSPSLDNPCIDGFCNITEVGHDAQGCIFINNTNSCSDNYTCTDNVCSGGVCLATNNNASCIVEALNTGICAMGLCLPGLATNVSSGCMIIPLSGGNACDDSVACTYNDTCLNTTTCAGTINSTYCSQFDTPCLSNFCNATTGCFSVPIANNTSCDTDAYSCTYQLCAGNGTCLTYLNDSACPATGNTCYDNICDPGSIGANATTGCRQVANTAMCDDGFTCTFNDTCLGGTCIGEAFDSYCDSISPSANNTCVDGFCDIAQVGHDPTTGCVFINNTNSCSDGYTCTSDVCSGGACVATANNDTCIVEALNTGACAMGYCNPATATNNVTGCVIEPLSPGDFCDDNVPCTFNDTCLNTTTCVGTANNTYCSSLFSTPCSDSACNATTGCFSTDKANGTSCDTDAFTCTYQLCAGNGTCLTYLNDSACPATGNVCVDNICDPGSIGANATTGCRLVNNTSPCDDGFNCTISDTCLASVCVGTPLNSFCDALAPSSGNPCIDGFCNITAIDHDNVTGCIFINNTNSCSDGYACTDDVCSGGVCVATLNNNTCIVEALRNGSCAMGYCLPGSATNVTSGCVITPLNVTDACDDGVACTDNDSCVNTTTCAGTTNDTYCHSLFDTPCADSFCNATTGCFSVPHANGSSCDVDTFTCTYQLCAGNGTCITYLNDSACPATGNTCVSNICDPLSIGANATTGCRLVNNSSPCDDGFNCTISDVCTAGTCVGTPLNSFCDALAPSAGNPCVEGFCNITASGHDNVTGCIFLNDDAAACTDGFQCTTDVCSNGTCVSTQDNTICILYATQLGGCGSGLCNVSSPLADNTTGCIIANATVGGPCDDSVACTFNDTCTVNGTCAGTTNNTACDFGGPAPCLNPVCDSTLGCINIPSPENSTCNVDTYTCTYQLCNATGSCITFYNDSVCSSANPCLLSFCDPTVANASATTGCYSVGLDGTSCDDGVPCTSNDTCVAGVCTGVLNDTYCQGQSPALGNVCINTSCDPLSIFAQPSGCTFSFNNVPCNDTYACTNNDICFLGVCSGAANTSYCDAFSPSLGNPCVDGTCSPGMGDSAGCVYSNNSLPCNDSVACTANDTCAGGVCAGTPSNSFCASLATMMGQCINSTCDATNSSGRADAYSCVYDHMNSSQPCDDNITCTQNDACDITGACHGTPNNTLCANVSLPMGMMPPCAFYTCNAVSGCVLSFALGGTACDDGFSCSVADQCDGSGHCVGTPVSSFCQSLPPASLNECLNGTCSVNDLNADNVTGCVFTNNMLSCDDGIPCTNNDTCSGGVCAGTPNNSTCTMIAQTIGDCVIGVCSPGSPFYDPTSGCVFSFAQAGQSCDDGQQCTYNDTCMLGGCVGVPNNTACYNELPMGADSVCVNPLCISFGVGCIFIPVPSGTPCNASKPDDGYTCTSFRCNSSSLACDESPTPGFCDVVGECFVGACDPTNMFANNVTGCAVGVVTSCDDGIPCTADICAGSMCIGSPVNTFCTALLPNTTGGCVSAVCNASSPSADINGCVNTNVTNGLACDDGIVCTDDVCVNGMCVGTPNNLTCVGIALGMGGCQTGYCSPSSPNATSSGCVFTGLMQGDPCDDMNPCTFNDTCNSTCAGTPNTTYCVENIPLGLETQCVNASCNALLGCLYAPLPNTTACTDDGFSCTTDLCRAPGFCYHAANNSVCPGGTTCAAYVCNPSIIGADPMTGCAATFTMAGTNCSDIPDDGFSCTTRQCNGFGSCVEVADNSLCPSAGGCTASICNTTDPGADPITGCIDIAVGPDPSVLLNISTVLQTTNTRVQMCAARSAVCLAGPADPSAFWASYVPGMSLPAAPSTVPAIDCIPLFGSYTKSCIRNYASEIIHRASRAVDCELLLDTIQSQANSTIFTRMCECEALCHLGQPLPPQCPAANPFSNSGCGLGADSATGSPGQIAAAKHISCPTLQMVLDELNYANGLLQTLIVNCTLDDDLSYVRRYPNNTYWATMAYEDTIDLAFDFDYNDFVTLFYIVEAFNAQNNLIAIYLDFLPLARGSMYEHKFIFSPDGKFDSSPNLIFQMPRPLVYGNYTVSVQRHSTSGAYMGLESSQAAANNGQDLLVISSTMTALMNPSFNPLTSPWSDYFVNTICDLPLKKPEYSYHLFLQNCNDTLNNATSRPFPGFPIYYFKLYSVGHEDQTPILYDLIDELIYNGMDILDEFGHPFAFVQPTMYDWPCEEYNIGPEYPGFMDLRNWLLDPGMYSPIVITGEFWYAFPDPFYADHIVESASVPPF